MKRKLWIILLVFIASLLVVIAHDEGSSYQPQPTQHATDETGTQITTNTDDATISDDLSSLFTFNLGSRTLIILLLSGVLAVGMTGVMWGIIGRNLPNSIIIASILTLFTGAIHLAFGIRGDWLLLANGIGFLGFSVIRILDVVRLSKVNELIILALIGYTIATFVGYFLTHNHFDTIGLTSKITEAILFVVLVRDLFTSNPIEDAISSPSISPTVN